MTLTWKLGDDPELASDVLREAVAANALTITADVEIHSALTERIVPIVSQWQVPDGWGEFAAHDASRASGLNAIGYFGAVFDGRYVYFAPEQKNADETHGVVLRYDTHQDFRSESAYEAYDAGITSGLPTRGFYGAGFDGRYVYFVPRQLDMRLYHTNVLRFDTHGNFQDPSAWSAASGGSEHSSQGLVFDGRYFYFCPGFSGDPDTEATRSGRVMRLDTRADFQSQEAFAFADIDTFLGENARCFDGGAFDGRYVYMVPIETTTVVRYDTQADFASTDAWQAIDAGPAGLGVNVGIVFDGRYLYCCAYAHARMVRYDTTRPFDDLTSWENHDAADTDALNTCGFDGGFFDGRFVYFVPFVAPKAAGGYEFHANFLRYDTTKAFNDRSAWQARDASRTNGLKSFGYNAGAFDGRYFYAAPWQQGPRADGTGPTIHGTVLRYDTLGDGGMFALRLSDYGHNGGLCAALRGPTLLINTDRGCFSVSAPSPLPPGRHELKAVVTPDEILLYISSVLVDRRPRRGNLVASAASFCIENNAENKGKMLKGLSLSATRQD